MTTHHTVPISKELLEILVCPIDHSSLRLEGQDLVCEQCGRRFPIIDGIPNMLVDEE